MNMSICTETAAAGSLARFWGWLTRRWRRRAPTLRERLLAGVLERLPARSAPLELPRPRGTR